MRSGEGWRVRASTLDEPLRSALTVALGGQQRPGESFVLALEGSDYVTLVAPLSEEATLHAVLQRSLDAALAPYYRLRLALFALIGVAFVISVFGASAIARGVSGPMVKLVAATRRVRTGDYGEAVAVDREDEIGELATAFNTMTQGIAERDRVRDLLGKVVDPAVASELLGKEVELGGEERQVSVLFSDIRGFTSLSEQQRPRDLINVLNRYFTDMSACIETESGVIDKYIGDAIMALFGAPLKQPDHAARAIRAALGMIRALSELNRAFGEEGLPVLAAGIGVNTALVVVGNMGSARRLNYTAIGDGVNLASRIEGLTPIYGVPVIVSEGTAAAAAPDFVYRELDRVRVKGRREPVRIFEPVGEAGTRDCDLDSFHQALEFYRRRQWRDADAILSELSSEAPQSELYRLYRRRISAFQANPPPADWDGTEVRREK